MQRNCSRRPLQDACTPGTWTRRARGEFSRRTGRAQAAPGRLRSSRSQGDRVLIDLRPPIAKGDRLRPESSAGREQEAFTVSQLFDGAGKGILSAQTGAQVYLACSKPLHSGDRLFKVGTKSESAAAIWKKIRGEVPAAFHQKSRFPHRQKILDDLERPAAAQTRQNETLIVKVDSANDLAQALRSSAAMVLLSATKNNLERIAKQRFSPSQTEETRVLPASGDS